MSETVFASEDLTPEERWSAVNEHFSNSDLPMRLVGEADGEFSVAARHLDLPTVKSVALVASPTRLLRTPQLIRRRDPEFLSVITAVEGELVVSQAGRVTPVNRGELALYDSSQPFEIRLTTSGRTATAASAHVARELLRVPLGGIDRILARPLSGASGFGGMLAGALTGLTTDSGAFRPSDLPRLATLTHDLMAALITHHLEEETSQPEDLRHRTLLLSIESFVRRHLGDPQLTPASIAAAHHISVRHLHRLFLPRGTTVASWIRGLRLENARRDLSDPALRATPVHHIAMRWGFKDHSSFTRAFRKAFDSAPNDYRRTQPHVLPEG